jgi:hypothetical protein
MQTQSCLIYMFTLLYTHPFRFWIKLAALNQTWIMQTQSSLIYIFTLLYSLYIRPATFLIKYNFLYWLIDWSSYNTCSTEFFIGIKSMQYSIGFSIDHQLQTDLYCFTQTFPSLAHVQRLVTRYIFCTISQPASIDRSDLFFWENDA